jgi:hypothetical protein
VGTVARARVVVRRRRQHVAGRRKENAGMSPPESPLGEQIALPATGDRQADRHVDRDHVGVDVQRLRDRGKGQPNHVNAGHVIDPS